jgi:hypothetical protein
MDFNTNQLRAIALLATGVNFRQCAKLLKIERYTLYRWRQEPEFQKAVETEKKRFISDYRQELSELKLKAVKELNKLLDDPKLALERKISICFDSLNLCKTIHVDYLSLD